MFSKACEYAIRATLLLASHSMEGRRASVKEIAEATGSPLAFTAKVLQQLNRGGIVQSVQGKRGGFEISQDRMKEIRLSHIVALIDGDSLFTGCVLGLPTCNEQKPCPLHDRFAIVRNELSSMLESTSILDLALGLNNGLTFLKR
jgi:Rrf2 family transcriptional regulator, iron-sulfur cluster assembly transcription factor